MAAPNVTAITPSVGVVKVWILPAAFDGNGNASFPWSLGFVEEPRLIPNGAQKGIRGSGSASFRLLRSLRDDGTGAGMTNLPGNVVVGAYCAITVGTTSFSSSYVVWWGYIKSIQSVEFSGGIDTIGTVTAGGIGEIVDGTTTNYLAQGTSGGSATTLTNPPSFNLSRDDGEIIGNKVVDGSGIPVFASTTAQCGTYWSRADGLTNILTYAAPDSIPALTLNTSSGLTTYLSDTTVPEVFEPRGQTMGNLLDLFISRPQGFCWDVIPNSGGGWTVYAFATNDNLGAYDPLYPAQSPINVDVTGSQVMDVGFHQSSDDLIDSVTVEGAPIIFCASVNYDDGNLDLGWTTAQETTYRAGASGVTGYASLTPVQKAELNQQIREGVDLRDVFELFKVDLTGLVSNPAGQGGGSIPLVPLLNFDGTTVTMNAGTSQVPYIPRTRLCRTLPWQVGIKADGTDARTAAQKAQPAYLEPRLFIYDAASTPQKYMDLMIESGYGEGTLHAPSLSMDDRSAGIRVKFGPKEILAQGHWTAGVDAICKLPMGGGSTVSGLYATPDADPYGRCMAPEAIVATVAYPSDQRISWVNYRAGITSAAQVRRNVTISADHLQLWYVHAGAILGVNKTTGQDDYVTADTITRNDWKTVKHLCDLYAAWYFRKRTAVVLKYALPGNLPAYATIGTLIGQVVERNNATGVTALDVNAYTVIESISYDFGNDPSATIATSLPPAPNFGGGQVSPSLGGSISASLGTTPALATQRGQQAMQRVQGDHQRAISLPARGAPSSSTNTTSETVSATAHGFSVGQVIRNGALYTGSPSATLSDVGIVTQVFDANHYSVTYQGFVYNYKPAGALIPTAGQSAWLSTVTAGLYSFTANPGGIKLFDAVSATKIYVNPMFQGTATATTTVSMTLAWNGNTQYISGWIAATSTLIWVDTAPGGVNVLFTNPPTLFGDAAIYTGTLEAASFMGRPLYRIVGSTAQQTAWVPVRYVLYGNATVSPYVATVSDTTGAAINTTINGSSVPNIIPFMPPRLSVSGGTTFGYWDWYYWTWQAGAALPDAVTGFGRRGISTTVSSGLTSGPSCNIDDGEVFSVEIDGIDTNGAGATIFPNNLRFELAFYAGSLHHLSSSAAGGNGASCHEGSNVWTDNTGAHQSLTVSSATGSGTNAVGSITLTYGGTPARAFATVTVRGGRDAP